MSGTGQVEDRRVAYERDGYALVRGLVPVAEARALHDKALAIASGSAGENVAPSQVQRQFSRGGRLRMIKISQLTRSVPMFQELAHRSAVVDVVEELIGPGARLFRDVVVGKPAHTGGRLSYHQDSAFWDIEPMSLVSVWVALTDVPPEAGCLDVLPGSHRSLLHHGLMLRNRVKVPMAMSDSLRRAVSRAGTGDNPEGAGGNLRLWKAKSLVLSKATRWVPVLGDLQDFRVLPGDVDERSARHIAMRAGDALFFHSLLIHGSGPNLAGHDRYADIISYAPSSARFVGHGEADLPVARTRLAT